VKRALALALVGALAAVAATRGLPARPDATHYPAHSENKGVTVAADPLEPDQVKGMFSTNLKDYIVVEVGVYPKKDGTLDLSTIDFALLIDGRTVRPTTPRSIAGINQRKARSRMDDITLWPSVGVSTGSWGTGTNVGVGVGMGGNGPGPASTDADRRTMEAELDDQGLQDATINKPVAGYLYFPAAKRKDLNAVLEYNSDDIQVRVPLKLK
jgi:hypothetical protein